MFIQRNYDRTEHDDFVLNVENQVGEKEETLEVRVNDKLVGWKIQRQYE